MHVSAKTDYAVRAAIEVAKAEAGPIKREAISRAQGIPISFLENILIELKNHDIVRSQRGSEGGFRLARPAEEITIAEVIRAVDGPLANVRGSRPESVAYAGSAEPLRDVWIAVRASLRSVLEEVTLADLASGALPNAITELTRDPGAWAST